MIRLVTLFFVGLLLLVSIAVVPSYFNPQRLSTVESRSVRVESLPPPRPVTPRSRSTYPRPSSYGSRSSSSGRYSSGGGFSSGK